MADSSGFQVSVRLKYIKVDEDVLLEKGQPIYTATERAGRQAVRYVQDEIIRMDAVDSGELYNSIDYEIFRSGRGLSVAVGPKASSRAARYARYVHDGTKGPIRSKSGKLMPVKLKGRTHVLLLSEVNGQEPKPYLANALKKIKTEDFR